MKYFAQRFVTTQRDLFVPVVSCCVVLCRSCSCSCCCVFIFDFSMAYRLAKLSGRTVAAVRGTLSGTNELEIVVIVRHMSNTHSTQKTCIPI